MRSRRRGAQRRQGRASDVLWVLVSCNRTTEAGRIGDAVLSARAAACFSVFPRSHSRFFWPPKSGKKAAVRGALLVLETVRGLFGAVDTIVRRHHSDTLPFIGALTIEHVAETYRAWMRGELQETPQG